MTNENRMLFGREFQEEIAKEDQIETFDFDKFKNLGAESAKIAEQLFKEEKLLAEAIKRIVNGETIISINRSGVRIHLNQHEGFTSEHLDKVRELVPMVRFEVHYHGPGADLGKVLKNAETHKQILTVRW